jgi:hypothetical protein
MRLAGIEPATFAALFAAPIEQAKRAGARAVCGPEKEERPAGAGF